MYGQYHRQNLEQPCTLMLNMLVCWELVGQLLLLAFFFSVGKDQSHIALM